MSRLTMPFGWLLLAAACASPPPVIEGEAATRAALPFLVVGETTREALIERLGTPAFVFDAGRIVTWRVEHTDDGIRPLARAAMQYGTVGQTARWYGLVVVFDPSGRIERFRLVEQV